MAVEAEASSGAAGGGGGEGGEGGAENRVSIASRVAELSGPGVLVRFVLEPDGYIDPVELPVETEVVSLKEAIAADVGGDVEAHFLVVRFNGIVARPGETLWDCGLRPGRRVYEGSIVIDPGQTSHEYSMPDILVVSVLDEASGEPVKDIWVEIDRSALEGEEGRKTFLGGFRHKESGVEYHHAWTQTPVDRRPRWEGKPQMLSRETQTTKLVTRSVQTRREASTQVDRPGLWVDRRRDREIAVGTYMTADELDEIKADKVLLLQRCWRGFMSRKRAATLRASRAEAERALAEASAKRQREEEERRRREQERRTNPRTAQDFAVLYGEVEAWRAAEARRLRAASLTETERVAAQKQLLARETRMLLEIERLKTAAKKAARDAKVASRLSAMAAAKLWQGSDSEVTEVVTPFGERARELKALFEALAAPDLAPEDRIDALLHCKWTVREFDCGLSREIVELVDREIDLLGRARPPASLAPLRKRIRNLFLQFVETPEFNPEAARFQKVPRDLASRPNVMPIRGGVRGRAPRRGREAEETAAAIRGKWRWKPDAPHTPSKEEEEGEVAEGGEAHEDEHGGE